MFSEKEFRSFVKSQIIQLNNHPKSITKVQILDAVCQFNTPIFRKLNKAKSTISEHLNNIFNLDNKPNSVPVNNWFLFNFGFKYCSNCDKKIVLSNFNKRIGSWDGLYKYCKDCDRLLSSLHYKNNKDIYKRNSAKYRAAKLNATPKWLNKHQQIEINDIYWQATEMERILGEKYHVDHIIPLQGKNVSGLHVPWNLQVLTAKENLSKSNKV